MPAAANGSLPQGSTPAQQLPNGNTSAAGTPADRQTAGKKQKGGGRQGLDGSDKMATSNSLAEEAAAAAAAAIAGTQAPEAASPHPASS